ncbi:hypothetical protein IU450_37900 [Nocardia abscessus]|uniref:hypothetical protein n=1 Tax=Nocardia abscessus TaxID=120957 RepID=UPI0018937C2D|nr:hypothetical protein [Nocardia abscessus]MBF6341611.1 hypothetical protein [Nocardia abscessus]
MLARYRRSPSRETGEAIAATGLGNTTLASAAIDTGSVSPGPQQSRSRNTPPPAIDAND